MGINRYKNTTTPSIILNPQHPPTVQHTASDATLSVLHADIINFSSKQIKNEINISITKKGIHPTMGLEISLCEHLKHIKLFVFQKGTPAGASTKRGSTLRTT